MSKYTTCLKAIVKALLDKRFFNFHTTGGDYIKLKPGMIKWFQASIILHLSFNIAAKGIHSDCLYYIYIPQINFHIRHFHTHHVTNRNRKPWQRCHLQEAHSVRQDLGEHTANHIKIEQFG